MTSQNNDYDKAMKITDQAEADEFLIKLASHYAVEIAESGQSIGMNEAMRIQRENLAYYAGYYDHETRLRIEKLFKCGHPIMGPATEGPVGTTVALKLGYLQGRVFKLEEALKTILKLCDGRDIEEIEDCAIKALEK